MKRMTSPDIRSEKPQLTAEEYEAITTVRKAMGRIASHYPSSRHPDTALFGQIDADLSILQWEFKPTTEPTTEPEL